VLFLIVMITYCLVEVICKLLEAVLSYSLYVMLCVTYRPTLDSTTVIDGHVFAVVIIVLLNVIL
jgi:hypothetical protein